MSYVLDRRRGLAIAVTLVAMPDRGFAAPSPSARLVVFAAASLTEAFKDVDAAWQALGHTPLRMSFAASSTLAGQIDQGADASLFASADEAWMDDVAKHDLLAVGTRRTLLGNALVLVVPADKRGDQAAPTLKAGMIEIGPNTDFTAILGPTGRLAVGDPSNVPAGIYAKQALTRLGLWSGLASRLAPSESVRSALLLVERGEAPAAIVYSTDAAVANSLAIAGVFAESTHDPISYPFALTRTGDGPEARALLTFLSSPEGFAIFAKRGFVRPPS